MTVSDNAQPVEATSNGDTSPPPSILRSWLLGAQSLLLALSAICLCAHTPNLRGAEWNQVGLVICAWISALIFVVSHVRMRPRQPSHDTADAPRARLIGPLLLLLPVNVILLLLPFTDLMFRVSFRASLPELRAAVKSDDFLPHAGWFGFVSRCEADSGVLLTIQWNKDEQMSLLNSIDEPFTNKDITLYTPDAQGSVSDFGPCAIRTARRLADNWYLVYWSSPDAKNPDDAGPS